MPGKKSSIVRCHSTPLQRLARDKALLARLKDGARRTAREKLSWERIAGTIVETVERVLPDARSHRT